MTALYGAIHALASGLECAIGAVRVWAWDHYWYGPRGMGQHKYPHLANVPNDSLRYHWRMRHDG